MVASSPGPAASDRPTAPEDLIAQLAHVAGRIGPGPATGPAVNH
jgi:hypothetical protein